MSLAVKTVNSDWCASIYRVRTAVCACIVGKIGWSVIVIRIGRSVCCVPSLSTAGERGWHCGERIILPPMRLGLDYRTRRHKWFKFVGAGSC